ncbi:hypothetical protein HY463_01085 [Candidatus Peregrinibacteria bacterium]|nr:hypothetical protein [Candidatus Peregrinibacteria bacterium]
MGNTPEKGPQSETVPLEDVMREYTVVMDADTRTFKLTGPASVAKDMQIAANMAARIPSKTARVYPNAESQMRPEALAALLRGNPLFRSVGMHTMEALFEGASLLVVPGGADIISHASEVDGLVIPRQSTQVELFKGQQSIGEIDLYPHNFMGEFMMALNRRPTARVVNRSGEREFVHIPHALFAGLDKRARESIEMAILRNSALVSSYERRDPARSLNTDAYVLCEARADVPRILSTLRPFRDTDTDRFKSHYVKEYAIGDSVEPDREGYLGLILQGAVEVNYEHTDPMEFAKLAEVEAGNVIFEASAAGMTPPADLHLVAANVNGPTSVLWIYLAPDDPNYDQLRHLALHGVADKLEHSNRRTADILLEEEE